MIVNASETTLCKQKTMFLCVENYTKGNNKYYDKKIKTQFRISC